MAGLDTSHVVQALKELVLSRKLDVIFLSMTRVDSSIIESIRGEIKFDRCYVIDRLGRGLVWLCFGKVQGLLH